MMYANSSIIGLTAIEMQMKFANSSDIVVLQPCTTCLQKSYDQYVLYCTASQNFMQKLRPQPELNATILFFDFFGIVKS